MAATHIVIKITNSYVNDTPRKFGELLFRFYERDGYKAEEIGNDLFTFLHDLLTTRNSHYNAKKLEHVWALLRSAYTNNEDSVDLNDLPGIDELIIILMAIHFDNGNEAEVDKIFDFIDSVDSAIIVPAITGKDRIVNNKKRAVIEYLILETNYAAIFDETKRGTWYLNSIKNIDLSLFNPIIAKGIRFNIKRWEAHVEPSTGFLPPTGLKK